MSAPNALRYGAWYLQSGNRADCMECDARMVIDDLGNLDELLEGIEAHRCDTTGQPSVCNVVARSEDPSC